MSPFDGADRDEGSLSRRGFLGRSSLGAGVLGAARLLQQAAEAAGPESGRPEPTRHPLDPLTADEIAEAARIVRAARAIGASYRFVTIALAEPPKPALRGYEAGQSTPREAAVLLMDRDTGHSFEAIVDLRAAAIRSYEPVPAGLQPPIMLDEFVECEEAVKRSPAFLAALRKRGVEDVGPRHGRRRGRPGIYGNERPRSSGRRLVAGAVLRPLRADGQRLRPAARRRDRRASI